MSPIQIHLLAALAGFGAAAIVASNPGDRDADAASGEPVRRAPSALNGLRSSPTIEASMPGVAGAAHINLSGFAEPALYREVLRLDASEIIGQLERSLPASTLRTRTPQTREILFRRLIELDPERAFHWFAEHGLYELTKYRLALFEAYADADLEGALTAMLSPRSEGPARADISTTLALIRNLDRIPSDAWFRSMRASLAPMDSQRLLDLIASRASRIDPSRAAELREIFGHAVPQNPMPLAPPDLAGMTSFLRRYPEHWLAVKESLGRTSGPLQLGELQDLYLAAPPDKEVRSGLAEVIAVRIGNRDPRAALQWAESLDDPIRGDSLAALFHHQMKPNPSFAFEIAAKHRDERVIQSYLSELAHDWAGSSPDLAVAAAMLIDDESERTLSLIYTVEGWAKQNPVEAARFLGDPRVRDFQQRLTDNMVKKLQPSQISELLAASPLSAEHLPDLEDLRSVGEKRQRALERLIDSIPNKAP